MTGAGTYIQAYDGTSNAASVMYSNGYIKSLGVDSNSNAFTIGDFSDNYTVEIQGSGSASFAGGNLNIYTSGGVASKSNFDATGESSYFKVNRDKVENSNDVLFLGQTRGVDKFIVTTDGSAEFAGNVDVGQNPNAGVNQGAVVGSAGYLAASRPNDADPLFLGYKTGSTTVRAKILADGSAEFAGGAFTIDSDGSATSVSKISCINSGATQFVLGTSATDENNRAQFAYATGNGQFLTDSINTDTIITFPGRLLLGKGGLSAGTIINANGSASFAGQVRVQRTGDDNCFIAANGPSNGDNTVRIKADGSATFAGDLRTYGAFDAIRDGDLQSVLHNI